MNTELRPTAHGISRRAFIGQAALATSTLGWAATTTAAESPAFNPPIVVFSKVYQELKLTHEQAAELTAEAGLDGIDCPVRPGGEVLPDAVRDELPRYAAALQARRLSMPLLTTAITSPASPNAAEVLQTAKKLGVQFYRLGFIDRQQDLKRQLAEVRAQLKDLAGLNRQLGLGALLQNHSQSGKKSYLGGNLAELYELVKDFDPAQIGAAFDIGHALVVHGDAWRDHFERLKPHLKVAYVKDVKRGTGWVPFGQGEISTVGYFSLLRKMGYRAPLSLHVEFDWAAGGKTKTRAALLAALQQSATALRGWLKTA